MHPLYESARALLLDLDGTLVDSEPFHCDAHRQWLGQQGLLITDTQIYANVGKGDRAFYEELIRTHNVAGADAAAWVAGKDDLLADLYRTRSLPLGNGAQRLLDRAFADGLACMVVTSSKLRLCRLALAAAGLTSRLPSRVTADDVQAHKPAPDPYLLAAARLSLPPARCLVIEDSPTGVRSGKAAGCPVVAVAGLIDPHDLRKAGADAVVMSLEELF